MRLTSKPARTRRSWAPIAAVAALAACGIGAYANPVATGTHPLARLHVLILSGQNNHDWRTTTPALKLDLESADRFVVDVDEHPERLTAQALTKYDVIVSNWNAFGDAAVKEWPEPARQAILGLVRAGRGFVSVHAGSSSFYDWPEYQQMTGGSWALGTTGHGAIHPFVVQATDPGHPITHGLRLFVTRDELWHRTGLHGGPHPIAAAYSETATGGSGADEPIALVNSFGKGRSLNMLLGHDAAAMASSGFRTLLQRGVEWAATGKVTFPPPNQALSPEDLEWALAAAAKYHDGDRRDALWMLEYHVGQVANGPRAADTSARLAKLVADTSATVDARRIVLTQLAQIATPAEIPVIERLLGDPDLGTRARLALERMPGPVPLKAMRTALRTATGNERIGLMNSLTARRDRLSVPLISGLAASMDESASRAAVLALGRIGTPECLRVVRMRLHGASGGARNDCLRAMLLCADGLAADGLAVQAKPVYASLMASGMPANVRAAAFSGLLECSPAERDGLLLGGLTGKDAAIRGIAVKRLAAVGSASAIRAAGERLGTLSADVQPRAIALLQARGDASAMPAILRAAASNVADARRAALTALGTLGGADAVPVLARAASSPDAEERRIVREALAQMYGLRVDAAIVIAARNAPPTAARELIGALTERSARSTVPALLGMAEHRAEVRSDAVAAVGALGNASACPRLIRMLGTAREDERPAIETALAAICTRAGSAAPIVAAMPSSSEPVKASLVTVLGAVGGSAALVPIRAASKDSDPAVRLAAIKALSSWSDAAPLDDLIDALGSSDQTCRVYALRGVAQLSPLAKDRSPDAVVAILTNAWSTTDRPAERKALVAALGRVPALSALRAAEAHIGDSDDGEDAALSTLQVAEAIWRKEPVEAERVARKLQDLGNAALREQATSLLIKLTKIANLAIGATATKPDGLNVDGESQGVQAAIDGDAATFWDEDDDKSLYVLHVQLVQPAPVSVIRLIGYQHYNYAPKDFEILCDDRVVKKVENAQYVNNWLTVTFPSTRCGVVELRITGYYGRSPAIRELEIYSKMPGEAGR